jgi:DNA-binding NarL/FixJ family response regulator
MDGAELSQQLLALRPDLPIIMYTGYSETCNGDQADAIGIRAYVMKPVERNKLIQVVREVLDGPQPQA